MYTINFLNFPLAFFSVWVYYITVTPLDADIAQPVERILGKDEVPSSNLGISSSENHPMKVVFFVRFCRRKLRSGTENG